MSKRNPFWLRQIPEYSLVWGALDLTPYLCGLPTANRDLARDWVSFEFYLHRVDEQLRIDLYLLFNQSHDMRGNPMFYAGQGYRFEANAYSQNIDAVPIVKGLLKESPVVTTIEGLLFHPLDRDRHRSRARWDNAPRGRNPFYVPTIP